MSAPKTRPRMLVADSDGQIYDHPDLLMLCRRGVELGLPRPDEITPLPEESEIFLLPGRRALGFDEESGEVVEMEENGVAAFVCPGYTLTANAAYATDEPDGDCAPPTLPLFAYGAVGYAKGKFWVAAKKVDQDQRQQFANIPRRRIQDGARKWMDQMPDNRLVAHLMGCALTNCCPAARNMALGRFEAPLPTSRVCNARCVGCISEQPENSGFPATQQRIDFTPTPAEIVQIMQQHCTREKRPVFSFGQGCEGEPLTEAGTIAEAVKKFRTDGGKGTVNVNTNASLPDAVRDLAKAGIDSIRVSMNSSRETTYASYYRPKGYEFGHVVESIAAAKKAGLHVALNYLYFPGVSDTEPELAALQELVAEHKVDLIQLRNLNLDPELYLELVDAPSMGPAMGFMNFRKRLRKATEVKFGYFNPYIGPDGPEGYGIPPKNR